MRELEFLIHTHDVLYISFFSSFSPALMFLYIHLHSYEYLSSDIFLDAKSSPKVCVHQPPLEQPLPASVSPPGPA